MKKISFFNIINKGTIEGINFEKLCLMFVDGMFCFTFACGLIL